MRYKNAFTVNPVGKFEYDGMNDNLPTVTWIFPPSTQSEHPNFLPNAGAAFVASKIDAIAANPGGLGQDGVPARLRRERRPLRPRRAVHPARWDAGRVRDRGQVAG